MAPTQDPNGSLQKDTSGKNIFGNTKDKGVLEASANFGSGVPLFGNRDSQGSNIRSKPSFMLNRDSKDSGIKTIDAGPKKIDSKP